MILVDFSHLYNRGVYANRDAVIENPNFVPHIVLNMILNVAEKFGYSKSNPIVLAIDSKPSWRHVYFDKNKGKFEGYESLTYKGHRVRDEEIDWDTIKTLNKHVTDSLRDNSDFHVVQVPFAEADDIIAVIAKDCAKRKENCWVISSDKDFKQLQVDPYVQIYDPVKQIIIPPVNIDQFKKIHIIAGDKSDGIPAIKARVAEKTAEKMLPTLIETLKTDPIMKQKYIFNRALIDFDFIPPALVGDIQAASETSYNPTGLLKLFQRFGLSQIAERVSLFKLPSETKKTAMNSQSLLKTEKAQYEDVTISEFFKD
jgi:5'-3' exonuclease